ncbi:transcriptional regulatory protein DevR (DosR) [mine drainage metagenome]|uniref:Transcriptional regulatory protein DevR (DosR) n=1 Tax=mine drainage metagenome TaxID=410659 RepID=A0A1J5PPV9_9ZZZZ
MGLKLLIVDDSELIRNSLQSLLHDITGLESIATAATLSQAIERVRSSWPAMLVLDLHLADGNAISRIGLMKKLVPTLQIAVLTNDASEFNRIRCMQAGANWFFDKSIEFEDLIDVIRQSGLFTLNAEHRKLS